MRTAAFVCRYETNAAYRRLSVEDGATTKGSEPTMAKTAPTIRQFRRAIAQRAAPMLLSSAATAEARTEALQSIRERR